MIFYRAKGGAYISRYRMPKHLFVREFLGLSHEGAYTSRCQMPEFEQEKMMVDLYRGWSIHRGPYEFVWIYGAKTGC